MESTKGERVRLGISAPPSVTVDRSEVHQRRGEFEFEGDRLQPASVDPYLVKLAADLTDVAYRVALRHGLGDQWLEVQLELWRALTLAIENPTEQEVLSWHYPKSTNDC